MKIVQSYWAKPGKNKPEGNSWGWLDKKYFYFSWALSSLQFRKYYDQVELVTDKDGFELLVDKLGLPYTDTKVVLDTLNNYHPDLFALGKLYAYSIQEEPFIHADGDVFIWQKFSDHFENSSLLCQNLEDGDYYNRIYTKAFVELVNNIGYYPQVLDHSIDLNNRIVAVNAGIIGGSNIEFFKLYSKNAFDFVNKISQHLHKINVRDFNTIFEQFLFYSMAEFQNENIEYFRSDIIRFWCDIADYTGVPKRSKYIHLIGSLKRARNILSQLEHRLLLDYPEYYFKIMNLIRKNQI